MEHSQTTWTTVAEHSLVTQEIEPPTADRVYRLCLEGIPWCQFLTVFRRKYQGSLTVGNNAITAANRPLDVAPAILQESQQAVAYTAQLDYQLNDIRFFSLSDFQTIYDISFPSIPFLDIHKRMPFPTQLSSSFDPYKFLFSIVYLLSNNLIDESLHFDKCREMVDILSSQIPAKLLLRLFESHLPSISAAWRKLIEITVFLGHRDMFWLVMRAGLQHRGWILSGGHKYLAFAAAMSCFDIVQKILEIGIRPDDPETPGGERGFFIPAIIEATITRHLDCVQLLMENCGVNKTIPGLGVSNFDLFLGFFFFF